MKKKVVSFLVAALLCAIITLCHLFARLIIKLQNIDSTGALYIEAAFLFIPDIFFVVWIMVTGVNKKRYFLQLPTKKGLLLHLPLFLILVPFIVIGIHMSDTTLVVVGQLLLSIVVALIETLGFHGIIYARLKKSFSKRSATIIAISLFAIHHVIMALTGLMSYSWSSLIAIIVFGYVGMVLVIKSKSVLPLVLIRFLVDFLYRISVQPNVESIICNVINFSFMLIYGTVVLIVYIKRHKNSLDPCDTYSSETVEEFVTFEENKEPKKEVVNSQATPLE